MIQVQIASQLSPLGVEGVRWVLVDPSDAAGAAGPTPAKVLGGLAPTGHPADGGSLLSLVLLKLLLTGLALGAALWAAQGWLGQPSAAALAPLLGPASEPVAPAADLPRASLPRSVPEPAPVIPMPDPMLAAPPGATADAVPGPTTDAVPGAAGRANSPLPPAASAPALVLGPLLTAELR